jgi:hypothetical protein
VTAAVGRFVRGQPLGAAGAVVVLALIGVALLAPLLAPHGPKETGFAPYVARAASSRWGPTRSAATC